MEHHDLKACPDAGIMTDSGQSDFWDERYQSGHMPWDLRGVPRDLSEYLARGRRGGHVLIPGCGLGYEVRAFHGAGWKVAAIDFAPAAVGQARALLGDVASCVRLADFFRDDPGTGFDLIYERTFLCSLPVEMWPRYSLRAGSLLRPGGELAGVFFYGRDDDPPPHPLTPDAADALFGAAFELIEDRPIPAAESLPIYATGER